MGYSLIIVRDSRFPRFDISRKKDASMLEYINHCSSIRPRMVCNGKFCEITFENDPLINVGEWYLSAYTVIEDFDDGSRMFANTLSDGCVFLTKCESGWLDYANSYAIPQSFAQILCLGGFYCKAIKEEYQFSKLLKYRHTYCDNDFFSVTILPTQECNARCFYCFEQEKNSVTMSEDVISATVQYLCSRLLPGCKLVYTWFGGEPLLSHRIAEKIINDVNAQMGGTIDYSSSLITNGSLLTPSLIQKLKSLWNTTTVVLTIDGYGVKHDQRKAYKNTFLPDGSAYKQVLMNIKSLLAVGIHVICRLNLDKDNVEQLPAILSDLQPYAKNDLFSVQATTLHCPSNDQFDQEQYYTEAELSAFYNRVLSLLKNWNLLDDPVSMLPHRSRGNCAACSLNAVVIGADGQLYRCYQESMIPQNSVGSVITGIIPNETYFKWFNKSLKEEEKCINCKFFPFCEGGCTFYRFSGTNSCNRAKYYYNLLLRFIHDEILDG